jgi:hypothetical protein
MESVVAVRVQRALRASVEREAGCTSADEDHLSIVSR